MKEDEVPLGTGEEPIEQESSKAENADSAPEPTAAGGQRAETRAKETEEQSKAQKGKKRHKREDALKAQVEQLEAQLEEKQDRFLRLAAEFENHKRRTIRDFTNLIRSASEGIITQLVPIVDEGDILLNVYSVIAVSPESAPGTNIDMANNMVAFLTSPEIQELIGDYGVEEYGMQLFVPCAGAEPTS